MTIAAARCRRFLRHKQPGCRSGRAGFSASAVMTLVALTGTLCQVLRFSGREGAHQSVLGRVERRRGAA